MALGLYKFVGDCGRHGNLFGMFIADSNRVKELLEARPELYFGEVLGKHSDIVYVVDEGDINLVSDNPNFVEMAQNFGAEIGFDPVEKWERQADETEE